MSSYSRLALIVLAICLITGCFDLEKRRVIRSNARIERIAAELETVRGTHAEELWQQLEAFTMDSSYFVRGQLALSLGELSTKLPSTLSARPVSILVVLLRDSDLGVRKMAAQAIAKYAQDGTSAIADLESLIVSNPNSDASWFAAEALGAMGSKASAAVPTLVGALRYDGQPGPYQYELRKSAALALASIGDAAKPSLSTLKQVRSSGDASTRKAIEHAISKIENL